MSRIGNRILDVPANVNIDLKENVINISGKHGNLSVPFDSKIIGILNKNDKIFVKRMNNEKFSRMLHGTINALIANAITGVNVGHQKTLKISGVGYKATLVGKQIELYLGHSHTIKLDIPQGLTVECVSPIEIKISGADKAVVGEFAAVIRSKRPPEPYKGKGVMYSDERIIRKAGKTAEGSKK